MLWLLLLKQDVSFEKMYKIEIFDGYTVHFFLSGKCFLRGNQSSYKPNIDGK